MLYCKKCAERANNLIQMLVEQRDECASKAAELAATDSQQLQAKIAACIPSLIDSYNSMRDTQFNSCIETLRQLSAV